MNRKSMLYIVMMLARASLGHTNINLSMSYILIDENIELQAWVKNVFDEIDPIDVVDLSSVGADMFWFTDPRTYGVTLNFRF